MNKGKREIDVQNYQFATFQSSPQADLKKAKVEDFRFKEFAEGELLNKRPSPQVIKGERGRAKEKAFSILPIVEKHRGIEDQKRIEFERTVEDEVQKRVNEIKEEAFEIGYEEGKKLGVEESLKNELEHSKLRIKQLEELIQNALELRTEIFGNQKWDFVEMIKNLTKWVVLRELKSDSEYILRLLEKLVLELQVKNNLLIKVNKDNFQQMPHILDLLKERLGELTNTRIEIEQGTDYPGIIIESEKGILDGKFETQMKSLDNLFLSLRPEHE